MREIQVSGTLRELALKEGLAKRSGQGTFDVCTIKIQVRDSLRQPDGQYKWDTIAWCEASAYGPVAQTWAKRFKEGDAVELAGQFRLEHYTRKDGTPDARLIVEGAYGGAPTLDRAPKPYEESQPTPISRAAQSDDENVF
jgi:single-stranded DNA-binding protein